VVLLLLERRTTASPLLAAIERAFDLRVPLAAATVLEGRSMGRRAFARMEPVPLQGFQSEIGPARTPDESLRALAELSLARGESMDGEIADGESRARAWADYRPPRPGLAIFGAGDDTQPLLKLAKELGWYVSMADGRSHLVTRERFPEADQLTVLPIRDLPAIPSDESSQAFGNLHREDAAVVMTHSFEQDSKILACLLALDAPPAYIGVLGPQRRTYELLSEAARLLNAGLRSCMPLPASILARNRPRPLLSRYLLKSRSSAHRPLRCRLEMCELWRKQSPVDPSHSERFSRFGPFELEYEI
jgi:xanthine dehydrogenase accessory factor